MRLNLTVEEAIFILNRVIGRKIEDIAEVVFQMDNSKKLAEKIKKQIDKEMLKKYPNGIENDNSGN
jgi:hypothetical protein